MCGGSTLMGSTPGSGGQQEVFPFAYLQSALTHTFEEPEHTGSFTYPCALVSALSPVKRGAHRARSWEQLRWTPQSFKPAPRSWTLPSSKSSTPAERTCACLPVRLVQVVCLLNPRPGDVHSVEDHLSDYCSSPERCQGEKRHVNQMCSGRNAPSWAGMVPDTSCSPSRSVGGRSQLLAAPQATTWPYLFKVALNDGPISGKRSISEAFLTKYQTLLILRH